MNCLRNFRLLVAFVAVSFLGAGFAHAVNKDCQIGSMTATIVDTEVLNPNNGNVTVTRVTTLVKADDVCVEVEYSSTCSFQTQANWRTIVTTSTYTRLPSGALEDYSSADPIMTGTRNKCK